MYIFALPLSFMLNKTNITIYPVVLKDKNELIMVDCGYPFSLSKIDDELNKKGLSLKELTKIIITHHDDDHIGALKEIQDKYPYIEVLCSVIQKPYVTGEEKSLRVIQADNELLDENLSAAEREYIIKIRNYLTSIHTVDKVTMVNIGDVLPWCGGVEVVDTKGHMPGHISLYVKKEKILIAGDALVVEEGELHCSRPEYVLDMADAISSVRNLLNYDIERIICYHGGEYSLDVKSSLNNILEKYANNHNMRV